MNPADAEARADRWLSDYDGHEERIVADYEPDPRESTRPDGPPQTWLEIADDLARWQRGES